jgi:hypothetical protein
MGLATGAIDAGIFGAIMMMVLVTTLVTPPALAFVANRKPDPTPAESVDYVGTGIDVLVGGVPIEDRRVDTRRIEVRRSEDQESE